MNQKKSNMTYRRIAIVGAMTFASVTASFAQWNTSNAPNLYYTLGKVGIGKTDPTFTLDVIGNLRTSSHINARQYVVVENSGGNYVVAINGQSDGYIIGRTATLQNKFEIRSNGNSYFNGGNVGIGHSAPVARFDVKSTGSGQNLYRATDVNDNYRWKITSAFDMYFADENQNDYIKIGKAGAYFETGNMGLGMSAVPTTYRLDVNGSIRSNSQLVITRAGETEGTSPGIVYNPGDDFLYDLQYLNNYGFGFHRYNDGSDGTNAYISGYHGIDFFSGGVSRIRVNRNGNVGIGTIKTNGYKLAVEGKIGAREVNVNLDTWADYVFLPEYKLMPLSEVEQHIKDQGHLPEVPSEKEVLENGVNLGEMNALLLKKVEELTLHLIEQNKKVEALQKQVNKLTSSKQ